MSALRATPDAHTMLGYSETVRSVRRWILDSCMCISLYGGSHASDILHVLMGVSVA